MSKSRELSTKKTLLENAYSRLGGGSYVAFVDESYVIPEISNENASFYILTAYIAPVRLHSAVRDDLVAIVDDEYWHTTEAHVAGKGELIHDLCRYISEGGDDEAILIALKAPISDSVDGDEEARKACFASLLGELHSGARVPRTQLVVVEERRHQGQRAADVKAVKDIRATGAIGQIVVHFTSPSVERLLWVPDIVSFAQNHKERGVPSGYAAHLDGYIEVIPA